MGLPWQWREGALGDIILTKFVSVSVQEQDGVKETEVDEVTVCVCVCSINN